MKTLLRLPLLGLLLLALPLRAITNDELLPTNLVGKTLSFTFGAATPNTLDLFTTYSVTFTSSGAYTRTTSAGTYTGTYTVLDSSLNTGTGNRATTIQFTTNFLAVTSSTAVLMVLTQQGGIGAYSAAEFFNPLKNSGGTFTIGGAGSGGTTGTAPAITSVGTGSGTVGTAFSFTVTATGSPTAYSLSGAPSWLTISSSGALAGTPTAAGTFSFTITATNSTGSSSAPYVLTVAAGSSTGASTLSNGLIAYYQFENDTKDSAGTNHGTAAGGLTYAASRSGFGQAASFNGTNALVSIPHQAGFNLTGGVTWSVWVNIADSKAATTGVRIFDKATAGSSDGWLVDTYDTFRLRRNLFRWVNSTAQVNANSAFALNTWVHLLFTYNNGVLTMYQNGDATLQVTTGTVTNNSLPLQLGGPRGSAATTEFFSGLMDEVRIYNRVLTSTEISALAAGQGVTAGATSTGTAPTIWGDATYKQTTVPSGVTGIVSLAMADSHCLAVKSDGTVVMWGSDISGANAVPAGLTGVTAVSAMGFNSMALKSDGTVVAWGDSRNGQNNVPAGLNNVVAIACGTTHCLALKADGTVVAWGARDATTVPAGLTGVTAIAAGYGHGVALKSDGTVVAWGVNQFNETAVPAGLTGIKAIAAGGRHSLAQKADGTLVGWGDNTLKPNDIPAGLTGVTAFSCGGNHNLALKSDGTVVAWGYNGQGQCNVPAGLTGITRIVAGGNQSAAFVASSSTSGGGSGGTTTYVVPSAPANLAAYRSHFGETYQFTVTGAASGAVWGTDLYTDNSDVAAAAVHAGVLAAGQSGTVTLVLLPGVSAYTGSTRNGVTSSSSGAWSGSYLFAGSGRVGTATTATSRPALYAGYTPLSTTLALGSRIVIPILVSGGGTYTYQWYLNNVAISGATSNPYVIDSLTAARAGTYTVDVTNALGTTRLSAGTITAGAAGLPAITLQPISKTVVPGATFVLAAGATGSGLSYQWFRNGTALTGETGAVLLRQNVTTADAGNYTVRIGNSAGSITSSSATITLSADASRPANISVRTNVATGTIVIPGFFIQGSGTKRVLIRAVGPGLADYGVTGTMANPRFAVYRDSTKIAENDDWSAANIGTAFAATGAFPLTAGSADAALVTDLAAGSTYTVQVTNATGAGGVVLIEVYDADALVGRSTSKLVNVSVRGQTAPGDDVLTLGLVIGGTGPRTLLIRGIGPKLISYGVTGTVPDPKLQLFDASGRPVLANDDWSNADFVPEMVQASSYVGAFALDAGSKDAAMLSLLDPGLYTIQLSGAAAAPRGEALVEVYEVP